MTIAASAIAATISPAASAGRTWDLLVIGAGPAGALAARQLALGGASVLLVDKSALPRSKVCGSCLNGAALATLRDVGLEYVASRLGATPLTAWRLHTSVARAECRLPSGVSLSRAAFDAALVEEAVSAGAHFLPETKATVEQDISSDGRRVLLTQGAENVTVGSRVVLVADGLSGSSLAHLPEFAPMVSESSRVGAGVILDATAASDYAAGCIFMASGAGGYVGLVRLEDGHLDVACALDREAMREAGGPGILAEKILAEVKLPVPEGLLTAAWRGTPPLTRRRKVAGQRIIVLGDAAGYLEPFTGEGMAWALASAVAVTPLALEASANWRPEFAIQWAKRQRQIVGRKQRVCRLAGAILRRPLLAGLVSRMLAVAPWLAKPLLSEINRPARLKTQTSVVS